MKSNKHEKTVKKYQNKMLTLRASLKEEKGRILLDYEDLSKLASMYITSKLLYTSKCNDYHIRRKNFNQLLLKMKDLNDHLQYLSSLK